MKLSDCIFALAFPTLAVGGVWLLGELPVNIVVLTLICMLYLWYVGPVVNWGCKKLAAFITKESSQ